MRRMFFPLAMLAMCLGSIAGTIAFAQEKPQSAKSKDGPLQVGILIFEGVELLDFTGPAEVFTVAGHGQLFRVHTVAQSKKPVRTMGAIQVTPEFTYKDAPKFDILVIPGGGMSNVTQAGIDWIKTAAKDARVVMSVCMGAFLLAEAKLVDKIEITTHSWGIDGLKRAAPTCKVVSGRRFVDSGKIVTTGGVTAGIDGALHLVERFHGKEAARWTAEEWMEYKPAPADSKQAPPDQDGR